MYYIIDMNIIILKTFKEMERKRKKEKKRDYLFYKAFIDTK